MVTLGKNSVSLQGEDKAMQRYRSLNMNGDVVAKVISLLNLDSTIRLLFPGGLPHIIDTPPPQQFFTSTELFLLTWTMHCLIFLLLNYIATRCLISFI